MERCVYCGRPAERYYFGRSTRCTDCQRIYEEDARAGFRENRLGDVCKDPYSAFNRVWLNPEFFQNTN